MKKIYIGIITLIICQNIFGQATLPVNATFASATSAGTGTLPTGFTQSGLGGYAGALKFDNQDDYLQLFFTGIPGLLSFEVGVNNTFPGTIPATAVFTIQESVTGTGWTSLATYSNVAGGVKTATPASTSRYIRWYYTAKPSGTNLSLKNVTLAAGCTPPTLTGASLSATVCAGSGGVINLTGLVVNSTANKIDYTINGAAQTQITGVAANASGAGSFTSAALTAANDGQVLQITKVTNGSCTANFTQDVTLAVNPATVGGSISPSAVAVCTGTNSTLLTLSGHTGSIVKWQSSTDNFATTPTDIANTTTTLTATNLTQTTNYRAVLKSGACAAVNSAVATITVNNTVTSIALTGLQTIPVSANGAPLTVTPGTSSVTGTQWKYSNSPGGPYTPIGGETNPAYTPNFASAGTYYVICEVTYGAPCNIVVNSNEVEIDVTSNSIATTAASFGPLCNATSNNITLPFTQTGTFTGQFNIQYSDNSGIFPADATTQLLTYISNTATSVTATFSAGFTAGTGYRVRVVNNTPVYFNSGNNGSNITVTQAVIPAVTIAASPSGSICAGTNVTFTPTPTNGGTASYHWWKNGIGSGTDLGVSATYSDATLVNGNVIACVMTSSIGCVTSATANSNDITMVVNPVLIPSVSIAITTGSNPTCTNSSLTFTATPTNGGAPTYQWKVNGGIVGSGNTFANSTLANGDKVTCVMTSTATCASPSTVTSNEIIIINNTPAAPAGTPAQTFCAGSTVADLSATGTAIQWYSAATGGTALTPGTALVTGTHYFATQTDNGCESALRFNVTATVLAAINYGTLASPGAVNHLVISQVYGGGGNGGAQYNRDFVEIFNPTSSTVSVAGWTVQYAAATGTAWAKTANLTGSVAPGKYYLVQMTLTGATGSALPTPDFTVATSIDLSGTNGKVALCNNNTQLSGSCSLGGAVVDFVGYGSANCSEASSAAPVLTNSTANFRASNGCVDTDNNSSDFSTAAPAPRNSSTAANICVSGNTETICSGGVPSPMTIGGADGSGSFSYQWYSHTGTTCPAGNDVTGWTNLGTTGGANTATFTPSAGVSATTTFACFVTPTGTPTCGTGTWASGCRQVTINSVTGGTVGDDQSVCSNGDPNAFAESVASTGSGTLTYQWQSSTVSDFSSAVTVISGATSAAYDAPTGLTATTYYRRVTTSTSASSACTAFSNIITVTVTVPATPVGSITVTPHCSFSTLTFSGSAPAGFEYYWQDNTTGAVTSLGSASLPIDINTAGNYYVQALNTVSGCWSLVTAPAAVTITNTTTTIAPVGNQTIATGVNGATLTVTDGSTSQSHRWLYTTTSGSDYIPFTPAQTGGTYTPNFATAGTYYVICETTYPNPCGVEISNEVMITVVAPGPPVISHVPLANTTSTAAQVAVVTITSTTALSPAPFITYRLNGGTWSTVTGTNPSGNTWNFSIPGQAAGTLIEYFLQATNIAATTTSPSGVTQASLYGAFNEYTILCSGSVSGQVAFQGFETTLPANNWTYTQSCTTECPNFLVDSKPSATNPATDFPASSRIRTGTFSYQHVSNSATKATLTFANVNIPTGSTNIRIRVHVASISTNSGNGADAVDDYIKITANLDGAGFPGTADVSLFGRSNIRYGYGATGSLSTIAGVPVSYSPAIGGNQPVDGKSLLEITVPDGTLTAALKIEIRNNDGGSKEIWCLDDIEITADNPPASAGRYFRSRQNGKWGNVSTWSVSSTANGTYTPACEVPDDANADQITIMNGNTVRITADRAADDVKINSGGLLVLDNKNFTINNGTGTDLIIEGTLLDSAQSGKGVAFSTGATWSIASGANIIKTKNSSVIAYKDNYEAGIGNIPKGANWFYRYTGNGSVNTASTGMVYPNLYFENTSLPAGSNYSWSQPTTAFTGAGGGFVTVKGNLTVGGTAGSTGTVAVYNNNINGTPMQIGGDLSIGTGSLLTNLSYDNTTDPSHGNGTGFEIKGNVTVNGKLIVNGNNTGQLILSGGGDQAISGTGTDSVNIQDLTIDNNLHSVINNRNINVFGKMNLKTNAGLKFGTGDISLKSTALQTANVLPIDNTIIDYTGAGRFIVERYIATNTHSRAWQFLATPTTGTQFINDAWQEGYGGSGSAGVSGLGTLINGPGGTANGFDGPTGVNIKSYKPLADQWDNGPANTASTPINNPSGWMVFVRGDRNNNQAGPGFGNATVLRTRGKIYAPGNLPYTISTDNKYESVGNPYASAIDLRSLTTTNLTNFIYIWDPTLGAGLGFGRYRTLTKLGTDYTVTPPGGTYTDPVNTIESGQAFFIRPIPGQTGTVTFTENSKVGGSRLVSRGGGGPNADQIEFLRVNLSTKNTTGTQELLDGAMAIFGDYSKDLDWNDAVKFMNLGENTGFRVQNTLTAVESRPSPVSGDTLQLELSGTRAVAYQWEVTAQHMNVPGRSGWIYDKYLKQSTPLNLDGITSLDFTVTSDPLSAAVNRFRIVFQKITAPLPVKFISITAVRNADRSIKVQWKVDNEINITGYVVERSANGQNFSGILSADAASLSNYNKNDLSPLAADNYYRIKATGIGGEITYSDIVKVAPLPLKASISVYPNPVEGKTAQVIFTNQPEGIYSIQVINKLGQAIYSGTAKVTGYNFVKQIVLGSNVAQGSYEVKVINVEGKVSSQQVVVN